MRTSRLLLSALLIIAAFATPASATHGAAGPGFVPNLRSERVWFHCEGATKVHSPLTHGSIPWDTTAPAGSAQQGAGCGSLDNPLQGNNQTSVQDSHFGGTFEANLDAITVELHNIYVGPARATGPLSFNVRLTIDETPILGYDGTDVTVTPVRSSTGASEMVKFTITDIGLLSEDADAEHDVLLTVSGGKFVADLTSNGNPWRDTLSGWVYDTIEVPSGLTFNPPTLEAVKVPRS